ncbi:hypothetical protein [Algivirga pacifica]|uniref:DUF2335 domain-containing protein n=1 Tax=Algivirga pacifica TaxID=1162670 RepID=A0ABP9D765_9BACT
MPLKLPNKSLTRADIIDHYLLKVIEEKLPLHKIRPELEEHHVPDEEIRIIVRFIDEELQRQVIKESRKKKSRALTRVGLFLVVVGMGITIATYTGWIDMGDEFLIAYGPVLSGMSLVMAGRVRR